jgi:hypothetical protein
VNKSGTLIASALFTFGIAAAALAADPPKATATMAADTRPPGAPTVGPKEDQRAVDTSPPKSAGKPTTSTHKHKKTHKPATPARTTTK